MRHIQISKEELVRLYWNEKLTADEIGAKLGCAGATILQMLREHDIPRRNRGVERITLPRDELEHLYLELKWSLAEIAEHYGCSGETVRHKIIEFGIPRHSPSAARMTYTKRDFESDLVDKAYLIGFRVGDLNVFKERKTSEIIIVRCNSTQQSQIELLQSLFAPYGHVRTSEPDKRGAVQFVCHLNLSFGFLLPKDDEVESWIQRDRQCARAFVAGYVDAEGTFGIYDNRARFKVDSQDYGILLWIRHWLEESEIECPPVRCIAQAGDVIDAEGRYMFSKDLWRITVNRAESILKLIRNIQPFIKHRQRRADMMCALKNVEERVKEG